MRVVIAGAGIGGLTAGLFAHAHGLSVAVHEAASEIRELGVGVNLQPHAVRDLERLGLLEETLAAGNPCTTWALYNRFGQPVWSEPRGRAAGHPWPQISVHRGKLQSLLLRALRERAGHDSVIAGHRLTRFVADDDGVTATFTTGDREVDVRGDVFVGADGIHSVARAQLYPDEGDPRYSGHVLYRGVTRARPYLDGRTMAICGHNERKFITYPITPPGPDGTAVINWAAHVTKAEMPAREDWNRPGRLDDFAGLFADWRYDWLDVPGLMAGAEAVYEYPLVDRDPVPRWSHGRATLLGDAAHPMAPIGSNGASQAIRDAGVLGPALAAAAETGGDPASALVAYENERRPMTTELVLDNRKLGPEQVLELVHQRAPDGFTDVSEVLSRAELEGNADRYRAITWAGVPDGTDRPRQ